MVSQNEFVEVVAQAYQAKANQRRFRKLPFPPPVLIAENRQSFFLFCLRQVAPVLIEQGQSRAFVDYLQRLIKPFPMKRRSENGMPGDQKLPRSAKSRHVKRPFECPAQLL